MMVSDTVIVPDQEALPTDEETTGAHLTDRPRLSHADIDDDNYAEY